MKNSAKRHHYLSQCYLKGFTNYNEQLTALNLVDGKIFYPGPHNVGVEAYFNSFKTADGIVSNVVEFGRSQFEADVAKAICSVEKLEQFEGDDKVIILNLMSLFAVSNPFRREQHNAMIDSLAKQVLRIAASNVGYSVNGVLITEEYRKFIEEGRFRVELTKNAQIWNEYFEYFEVILETMLHRKWTLIRVPDEAPLVTCDFPIALTWKDPKKYRFDPGFGCGNTQVFFPLSQKFALIGDFEGFDQVVCASEEQVALINANILFFAKKQVYAPQENILFLGPNGESLQGLTLYYETFHLENQEIDVEKI